MSKAQSSVANYTQPAFDINYLIGSTKISVPLPANVAKQNAFTLPVNNLFLLLSLGTSAYFLLRTTKSIIYGFKTWLMSFFNSKKYLVPDSDKFLEFQARNRNQLASGFAQETERAYAVIYGASNKAGKAFAFYLM